MATHVDMNENIDVINVEDEDVEKIPHTHISLWSGGYASDGETFMRKGLYEVKYESNVKVFKRRIFSTHDDHMPTQCAPTSRTGKYARDSRFEAYDNKCTLQSSIPKSTYDYYAQQKVKREHVKNAEHVTKIK